MMKQLILLIAMSVGAINVSMAQGHVQLPPLKEDIINMDGFRGIKTVQPTADGFILS